MSLSFLSGHTSLSFRTWLLPNDIASPSDQDIPSAFRIPLIKHLTVISFSLIFPSHLHPHSPPHPPKKSKNIDSFSPSTRDTFHNPSRPLMRTRPPLPSKSLSLHSFRIHEGSRRWQILSLAKAFLFLLFSPPLPPPESIAPGDAWKRCGASSLVARRYELVPGRMRFVFFLEPLREVKSSSQSVSVCL